MTIYPTYYQQGSVCIKRESATQGKQVTIPEACRIGNYGFQIIQTKDKMAFDALVYEMKEVSFEVYERYLTILHQFTQKQPAGFRESHDSTPEFAGASAFRMPS